MKVQCLLLTAAALVSVCLAVPNNSEEGKVNGTVGVVRRARYDERKFSKYDAGEQGLKKEPNQFLSSKNLIRTVVKLFFGNDEESAATSRQILNILVSLLDMLKNSFGQRARSSESRGLRDSMDDAANAGASMLKGYVKSILAKDRHCVQKHLCEASKEAVKDGREIGYLIAQFGGYAASFALDGKKTNAFQNNYDATRKGRSGEDCSTIFPACNEA